MGLRWRHPVSNEWMAASEFDVEESAAAVIGKELPEFDVAFEAQEEKR